MYVKEQKGIDPLLRLEGFRQTMLHICRMGAMCKAGRLFYYRCIVMVGNGRGTYGIGVGFGQMPKDARKDATTKAMQRLEHLDLDEGRMLCTPVRGREFAQGVKIRPKQIGRGLQANKKFLPMLYLMGLDNAKVTFYNQKWLSRVKALRRALDDVYSRKTMANGTGMKYAALIAPGDHWVHWPDRWFDNVRATYHARCAKDKLDRRRLLHFRKKPHVIAHAREMKPGWTRSAWMAPLQRAIKKRVENDRNAYSCVGLAQIKKRGPQGQQQAGRRSQTSAAAARQ